jgi:dihydrofolate reductase
LRKTVLNIALSLDGYIAGPKGEFDWLFTDQDYGLKEFFSRIDTALIGRKTYDLMMKLGGAYQGMKNYVFSHSRIPAKKKNVVFVAEALSTSIDKLKSAKGKDIWLVGGGALVHSFLEADLVDEMILSIHPILLGKGIPLFRETGRRRDLELQHSKTYSSGLVQLQYVRSLPSKSPTAA